MKTNDDDDDAAVRRRPVEAQRDGEVYEETSKVEADMTFSEQRTPFAATDTLAPGA